MPVPVTYEPIATDPATRARRGRVRTLHGLFETPAFMPVGTQGTVKGIFPQHLRESGAECILGNTYHLMLRPGSKTVAALGDLHRFMAWDGPILTDSGGFQIFSLGPAIDEVGARFRSVYDGSRVSLTPEEATKAQEELGPDIAMALDVCVGLPAPREQVEAEMERTLRWAERCLAAHGRRDQALFGIVQGGVDPQLRASSAARTAALGFAGFGIGGLSVGESAEERHTAHSAPRDPPRCHDPYVIGPARTARWGSRRDPLTEFAGHQARFPFRCETEVLPFSTR